ncbi:MAG: DNA-formamidopyrimidine glycosylase [Clostridia bacterium]|nr:DNA-formamidopyrimidine glycosylase [Clostridia bacterium]
MPELPEVETIKRTLEPKILGRRIEDVEVFYRGIIKCPSVNEFIEQVKGATILKLRRRGKYLLIGLDNSSSMIISFRMTGQLLYVDKNDIYPYDKHTHVVFKLDNRAELRFREPRKFGQITLVKTSEIENTREISKLGCEPFSPEVNEDTFFNFFKSRRGKVKQLLMDQSFICGIGNIYSDEILFYAGIHPERTSNTLTIEEVRAVYNGMVKVLNEAIEQRGTSIKDYVDGKGNKGNYQNLLKVYGRKGEKCCRCGSEIICTKVGGRTAHFCPHCQK